MGKSTVLTYVLWLFGGQLGLHHFYLGRDRHAFTWFATLGGVFGLGWLREFTRLSSYVEEANQTKRYVDRRTLEMSQSSKPRYNSTRVAGELIVGTLFGYLLSLAIPDEEEFGVLHRWGMLVVPFAVATGVHLVGNIGMERGSFRWPLIGAYLASFLFLFTPQAIAWVAICSAFLFNWKSRDYVRQPKKRRNLAVRFSVLSVCGLLYLSLWGSFLYFNAKYTAPDGSVVTAREGIDNFFHSKAWKEIQTATKQIREYIEYHGWQHVVMELIKVLDPFGESRAYHILEINSDATIDEITKKYRKLSREWHPDRHRDPEKKALAEKRFVEINQAYEKITNLRSGKKEPRQSSFTGDRDEF